MRMIAVLLLLGLDGWFTAKLHAENKTVVSGTIRIDGSSTVFPISEALAEEFQKANPQIRVTVGTSGTGGGLKRLNSGDIDIANASRIAKAEERKLPAGESFEIPIAYDGITVVANKSVDFLPAISLADLKRLWEPSSKVAKWSELNPAWPDRKIQLYGPGSESGTFDYFTEAVVGKSRESRRDYIASEDDNILVRGIAIDHDGFGYFGFAYYQANAQRVRAIPLLNQKGLTINASAASIRDQSYPLSRPLYLYVHPIALQRAEVVAFLNFYLEHAEQLVSEVGYVPLAKTEYEQAKRALKAATTAKGAG